MKFDFDKYLAIERAIAYTVRELNDKWKLLDSAPELLVILLRLSKLSAKEFTVSDRELVLFQNHSYKTVSRGRACLREFIMINPDVISMARRMGKDRPYRCTYYKFDSKFIRLIKNRIEICLEDAERAIEIAPKRDYNYKKKTKPISLTLDMSPIGIMRTAVSKMIEQAQEVVMPPDYQTGLNKLAVALAKAERQIESGKAPNLKAAQKTIDLYAAKLKTQVDIMSS
jgi:soluble cytochrome b562